MALRVSSVTRATWLTARGAKVVLRPAAALHPGAGSAGRCQRAGRHDLAPHHRGLADSLGLAEAVLEERRAVRGDLAEVPLHLAAQLVGDLVVGGAASQQRAAPGWTHQALDRRRRPPLRRGGWSSRKAGAATESRCVMAAAPARRRAVLTGCWLGQVRRAGCGGSRRSALFRGGGSLVAAAGRGCCDAGAASVRELAAPERGRWRRACGGSESRRAGSGAAAAAAEVAACRGDSGT